MRRTENSNEVIDMDESIKELRGVVLSAHEEFKQQNDKAIAEAAKLGEATAETRQIVDKLQDEITASQKKVAELEARAQRPNMDGGESDPEKEIRKQAFEKHLRYGSEAVARCTPDEKRALSDIAAGDGGFLIPEHLETDIVMAAYNRAGFRPVAQVRQTGRDAVRQAGLSKPIISWGKGAITVNPVTGLNQSNIVIEDLKTLMLVHNNILDDAEADIGAEITQGAGRAIAEAEDVAFAAGLGAVSEQPTGVVVDAGVVARAIVSGTVGGLTVDDLINLTASVNAMYRMNGTFMFNSGTEAVIRTLKDTTGQYLWQPSTQAGMPATLLGKPIAIDEGMPAVATGAEAIVFGDFYSGYRIYDRQGVTIKRLDERYAELDSTGFIVKKRTGGGVVLAEAFTPWTIG